MERDADSVAVGWYSPSVFGRLKNLRAPVPRLLGWFAAATAVLWLLSADLPARSQETAPQEPEASTETTEGGSQEPGEITPGLLARVLLDGQTFRLPYGASPGGPMLALEPLVERLGGRLERGAYGEGWELKLGEETVLFAAESAAVVRGDEVVPLSRPPFAHITGLRVPLDFLEQTYGRSLGVRFRWDDEARTLEIASRSTEPLGVTPELVHLQGTSTLAFRFSEKPLYEVEELPDGFEIRLNQPLMARPWRPRPDPLVRGVTFGSERIRVRLAPGAAYSSYSLPQPFRLIFDLYQGTSSTPDSATPRLPEIDDPRRRDRPGVHTIVIDPGHGGKETGAVGRSGLLEKDIALMLARAFQRRLEQRMAVKAVLTRETDEALSLEARTAVANRNKADLFISIHLNSSYGPQAHGAETYILSEEATDERAAQRAELENQSGAPATGAPDPLYDLQLILWDMSQSYHLGESNRFATLVQQELNSTLGLRDRGVKQAPFRVLMGASMPAVLVELGFLSNPAEESKLRQAEHRAELVEALVRAVIRYKEGLGSQGGTATETASSGGEPAESP